MAHLKDLNSQMKIRAERIRLQSRDKDEHSVAMTNMGMGQMRQTRTITHNREQARSNQGSSKPSKVSSSTPSRIPTRKPVSGVSALKGKSTAGMSASKRGQSDMKHVHFGGASSRPADYTWHKSGRIQEIRTRYIARKFFYLWVSACFGKVGPQRIREHYRKQLLRRAWGEWHDLWWVNRREWRLKVRAQYHYRYCMTRKVWQAWLQYVVRQKVVNAKTNVACQHADTRLLLSTFTAWKQYMAYRNAKKKNFGHAFQIADTRRLSVAWQTWRNEMQKRENRDSMQQHALQFWADGLMYKTWTIWRSRISAIAEDKRKEQLAIEVYHKNLLSRCFYKGLVPYTLHRRNRKQDKGVASRFYTSNLVQRSFSHWHTSWFTRRSLALLGQQVDVMAERARLRRAWTHWMFYINLQHIKASKMAIAIKHYQEKLMVHGLHAFHTAVAHHKLKNIRKERADEMRYNTLLQWSWSLWLQGCEHKEELRIFVQSRKARNHYKGVLLSRVVHGWVQYTRWRQHRQAQYVIADAHFISCLLPKCLRSFQMFAQIMRDKRFNQEQSVAFRREYLLGVFFSRWYHNYQLSLDVRMMQRMAIMHYDHNVAQRMLTTWKNRTTLQLQEHAKECIKLYRKESLYFLSNHQTQAQELAFDHYEIHTKQIVIQTWKAFTTESIKSQTQEYQAATHHYHGMLRKGWQAWTKYVAHQRMKSSKLMKADMHHRQKLLKYTLNGWKTYHRRTEQTYEVVDEKEQKHNLATLRWAFSTWCENAQLQVEETRHQKLAEQHHKTCILKKVVYCWRQYAVLHAHKQSQKMERLVQIRKQLDQGKCRRAFQAWRSYKDEALLQHLAESRADLHHRRRLLHKTLQEWIRFRQMEIRKTLLQRQCVWLHNTRITAKYFLRWRAQHHAAIAENNKTVIALWQWSLVLQQKVVVAWLQYVRLQRHKKQRITVAMEIRRQRLLREGVGQWLRVATDMEERREKKAAQRHAQTAYRSYNIVKRCATHWRQKTLANRGKKSQRPKPQPSPGQIMPLSNQDTVRIRHIDLQPLDNSRLLSQPKPSMTAPSVSHRAPSKLKQHIGTAGIVEFTRHRPKPRRPDFLMDSLQKEGLWKSVSSQDRHRYTEPTPTQDIVHFDTSIQDAEDHDEVNKSLPRTQPPPPPSPQPKHFTQPERDTTRYREQDLPQHFTQPERNTTSSRKQYVPQHTKSPTLYNDDHADRQYDDVNERTSQLMSEPLDKNKMSTGMTSMPLLIPPSAFTGTKSGHMGKSQSHLVSYKGYPLPEPHHEGSSVMSGLPNHPDPTAQSTPPRRENVSTGHAGAISEVSGTVSNDAADFLSNQDYRTSSKPLLLSPDVFTSKVSANYDPSVDNQDSVLSEMESEDDFDSKDEEQKTEEDIYAEILELKNQLVQYQQTKQKLGSLTEQHKHLSSWLKELETLHGDSGAHPTDDDEDVETVQREVNEMEVEMAELTSELDRRKPECAKILDKINMLAKQIQ